MSQRTPDYDANRAAEARARDAAALARAKQTRRKRKCIAEGAHTDGGCKRCGL